MALSDTLETVFEYTEAHSQEGTGINTRSTEYALLKKIVKDKGLFERQPAYYVFKFSLTFALYALGVAVLLTAKDFWLLMLAAPFMAFAYAQVGMLGHDLGHRQITRRMWQIDTLGMLLGNFFIGLSQTWWVDKHNEHHAHPNEIDGDPDIDFPIIVFAESQIEGKNPLQKLIIKYQAFLFFPLLTLVSVNMRMHSFLKVISGTVKYKTLELLVLLAHYTLYFLVVFHALPGWNGVLFIFVHQALFGLYMGGIFAPNHKGMPVLEPDHQLDFLRLQVLTARNIRAHPATDFLYGGLNYQVEHHLFPTVPRNKLGEVHKITKQFCKDYGIPFYETSPLRSYIEIVQYLHQVSAPLRTKN